MLKTSSPLHPLNRHLPRDKNKEQQPNARKVQTRRRIEDALERRRIQQDFTLA
jgi:hypothetical protein